MNFQSSNANRIKQDPVPTLSRKTRDRMADTKQQFFFVGLVEAAFFFGQSGFFWYVQSKLI
jgi:hypothetical protein